MDRLTSLAIFVAAIEEGSLAGAGRRFGLSPAMAGKHVGALEEDLGVRLLHRTTRKLSLTEAGRTYLERGRHILEAMEEADQEARDLQDEPRGTLRVTAPTTFGALHMGAPIAGFIARYPGISVEMQMEDRYVDIVEAGFEVAIRIGILADSSLIARKIAQCRMVACGSPAYFERHGFPETPDDLAARDRLAYSLPTSPGDWTFTDRDGRAHRVEGVTRLRSNNVQMLLAAALADGGIAYGPSFVFGPYLETGALKRVLPSYQTATLTIQAVYPSSRLVPVKVRRFVETLEAAFGDLPPWDRWTVGD